MRDEREVSQVTLNRRVEDVLRARVAQRRPVLVQEIHQLLRHLLRVHQDLFPLVRVVRLVGVGPGQVLGNLPRGEFRLANVPEIARQMNGFALDERRQQRYVGGLSSARRQVEANFLQLFAQQSSAVFALGAS